MYTSLRALRAKIRGFQAEGISIAGRIRKASGAKRNALWDEKRRLGCYNRLYLVAYGLLRDVPYERIERCARHNELSPESVFAVIKEHGSWEVNRHLTLDHVKGLLTVNSPNGCVGVTMSNLLQQTREGTQRKLSEARRSQEKGAVS